MRFRNRYHGICENEGGNMAKPTWQLHKHTAKPTVTTSKSFTTGGNTGTQKTPKRLRRSMIPTTAYSEPNIEQDIQVDPATVHLSDSRTHKYQNSDRSDETE